MMEAIPNNDPLSVDHSLQKWQDWIGRLGLFTFFLFYQLNATVAYIGFALVILVFLFQTKTWWLALKGDTVARIYLILVIYILGYAVLATLEFPETLRAQRIAVVDWMHWFLFIPIAWVVRLHYKQLNILLLALASGMLIRILTHAHWDQIATIFSWPRMGFGITETVFAPLAGMTTLGFLLLAPRFTNPATQTGRWSGIFRSGLWLIGLIILLQSLVLSQTRGVWLAAAIVFPIGIAIRYENWLRNYAFKSAKNIAGLILVLLIVGLFIQLNSTPLSSRIKSESLQSTPDLVTRTVEGTVEGDKKVILTSGISYRLILWGIGFKSWKERPLLGWGPGTSEYLVQQADNALLNQHVTLQNGKELSLHLTHLHSVYLEIMVRFGVLGGVLFFASPVLLLLGVRKAYLRGTIPWDYVCFIFAGWGFLAMEAFTDFQIFKFAWRNFCVIWAALSYAVYLENIIIRESSVHEKNLPSV
jgi:O-antigen ligase